MSNEYTRRFANMNNAGGNHQSRTVQGVLQEGQKSYKQTVDKQLGTNNAPNAFERKFRPITPPKQVQPPIKTVTPKR